MQIVLQEVCLPRWHAFLTSSRVMPVLLAVDRSLGSKTLDGYTNQVPPSSHPLPESNLDSTPVLHPCSKPLDCLLIKSRHPRPAF